MSRKMWGLLCMACLFTGCGNEITEGEDEDETSIEVDDDEDEDDEDEAKKTDPEDDPDEDDEDPDDDKDGTGDDPEPESEPEPETEPEPEPEPDFEPEPVVCDHDVCVVNYEDVLSGNVESLGNTYFACENNVLNEEISTCPEDQVCLDGGCVDAFVEGDREACKIDPSYEFSLFYEDDHGKCTAGGNYAVACKFGKIKLMTCQQPCEDEYTGYVRCPKIAEGTELTYRDIPFDERFVPEIASLDEEGKVAYAQAVRAILLNENVIALTNISKDNEQIIWNILHGTLDNWNWRIKAGSGSSMPNKDEPSRYDYEMIFLNEARPENVTDEEMQKYQLAQFDVLEQASVYKTDIEKEVFIHDWIAKNTVYKPGDYDQTAYDVLVNHEAVCAGYSNAFKLLMRRLLVPTFYISGTGHSDKHAWNVIRLDDKFYNVDVTWDRIDSSGIRLEKDEPWAYYKYFNQTDEFFEKNNHKAESPNKASLTCDALDYAFDAILGIDDVLKALQYNLPMVSDGVATSVEEFYEVAKKRFSGDGLDPAKTGKQSVTKVIVVVGNDVANKIAKLSKSDLLKGFLDEVLGIKFSDITIKSTSTSVQNFYELGENVRAVKLTVTITT